jgi:hypothetical protein
MIGGKQKEVATSTVNPNNATTLMASTGISVVGATINVVAKLISVVAALVSVVVSPTSVAIISACLEFSPVIFACHLHFGLFIHQTILYRP